MKGSIQTLLAILVLFGGASVSSLIEVAEAAHTPPPGGPSMPSLPDEVSLVFGPQVRDLADVPEESGQASVPLEMEKNLDSVRSELTTVELPGDIAELMHQLSGENPGVSMKKLINYKLLNQRKPESCPEFVKRIKTIKEKHCGLLENIDDYLVRDENISPIIFAAQACIKLASLEAEKEHFYKRRDEIFKAYEPLTVPEDLMGLIRRKENMNDWTVTEEDKQLEESCDEFTEKADPVLRAINDFLLDRFFEEFGFGSKLITIMKASQLCKEIKNHIESLQSVAEGSSQSMELDHE